jgi:hypothetical protein
VILLAAYLARDPGTTVRSLHLGDCCIGELEAGVLCGGLRYNRGMRHLDLRSNPLGVGGAHALASLLKPAGMLLDWKV